MRPYLSPAYLALAFRLQEDAGGRLTAGDTRSRLNDAIQDQHRGSGSWGYYMDHIGDDDSGDVVYCSGDDVKKAPYSMSNTAGSAAKASVDFDSAVDVVPRTVYDEEADEGDHYAAMEAAMVAAKLYKSLPLYERFVSKTTRDNMDSKDFAGKGKSFPIDSPEDVAAAAKSIGRAGSDNYSTDVIKANIIKIATRKGAAYTAKLPKAWKSDAKESAPMTPAAAAAGKLALVESFLPGITFLGADLKLQEAGAERTRYPVMLISPGTGSTAHYPAKVLERDGPKIFKKGTLMFWNHPTAAEESQRPEGDLNNLAAILTSDARWEPNGPKGAGLYGDAAVMADYAQKVAERAPHIGLSIRAGGTGTGRLVNGKPELASLDYAESVDYVTRAGRGGLALAEAARDAGLLETTEVSTMDPKEVQLLREQLNSQQQTTTVLLERELRRDAIVLGARVLEGLNLPVAAKQRVVQNAITAMGKMPVTAAGVLDEAKLTEAFNAGAKDEAAYLSSLLGGGRVHSMGAQPAAPSVSAEESKRMQEAQVAEDARSLSVFERLCGNNKAAGKMAFQGRPVEVFG